MSAVTFDTHKFVERLEKAGASRELAAALVNVQRETIAEAMDTQLATKGDMATLKADIARLDAKFDRINAETTGKFTFIQWMLGILLAGVMSLILKTFF